MHPKQKINFKDWYMKIDPPMWMAADFECMNVPVESYNKNSLDELFIDKPVATGYKIVKNMDYDNLNLEKIGYIKHFGEHCVEWFINEMLEIEGYLKNYLKNELENSLDTILINFDQSTCWLCEKEFRPKDGTENPIVKDHGHLTGKFGGLAHIKCNIKTLKAHTSFVLLFFHNFLGYYCHLILENLVNMATEKKTLK